MNRNSVFVFLLSGAKAAAAALVLLFALAQPAAAQADQAAEDFVQQNIQHGLSILNNHNISDADRRSQFREFLTGLTDIRRIALYTLGSVRRTASPGDVEAFVSAFRDYAVAVYESRLQNYAGQSLKVTGATEHGPNDTIVSTILVDSSGRVQGNPIHVDFRVQNTGGKYVVIDVSIEGVWLAIEEQEQFEAFLEQNNNSVVQLIGHLNALTDRLVNGGPHTPAQ
jgi:phospholipid transport system substrate-binding protein